MTRRLLLGMIGLALALAAGPARAQTPAPAAPAPSAAPAAAPAPATAAPSGPVTQISYFSVAPGATRKTAGLLRQFQAAAQKADGNTELTILHEIGRPGRFAVVEGWRDKAALEANGSAEKTLVDKVQAAFLSPFETRLFVPLSIGKTAASVGSPGTVYVLTHVDVFPAGKDEVAGLVKSQAEASASDQGVLRFDALVWDGHANHFHLIEAWSDRKAQEAHAAAEHTKTFRAKVTPFEGAFYDQRLYAPIKEGKEPK